MFDYITGITIGFASESYFVNEKDGTVTLTVLILDGLLKKEAVVKFFTTDGSATSMLFTDFEQVSGIPLVFDANASSHLVNVTITDDNIVDSSEFFYGNLSTTDGGVDLAPATATVTIIDEDTLTGKSLFIV